MRFSFQSGVRNDLIQLIADQTASKVVNRNPISVGFGFAFPFGPHGATVRVTYTVPANRYAEVSGMNLFMQRQFAAVASPGYLIRFDLTPSGGGFSTVASLELTNAAIYEKESLSPGGNFIMSAGDQLDLITADASAGGSVMYTGGCLITEYDA